MTFGQESETYLWPSIKFFITHLLFTSLHLHFSLQQKNAILKWAKEMGAPDVPSLRALQRCQEQVEALIGILTRKTVSALGNIFYINDICSAIAKDFVNPLTCFAMVDYLVDGGEGLSEVFNGDKMLDGNLDIVSPAVQVGGWKHLELWTV
ncbi:hypothetical protein ID866_13332 [Astraeus odoratus]|nr:hypothetical protein ID866_13332 [Astraeus odoratus]